MVGFVEEIPEEVTASPPPPQPSSASSEGPHTPPPPPRAKGAARIRHWKVTTNGKRHEALLLTRYFTTLWEAVLEGRRRRQEGEAVRLLDLAETRLVRAYYDNLLSSRTERIAQAEEHKKAGNQCYASGDYEGAIQMYSKAIHTAPKTAESSAAYYCNRAACHMKTENWRDVEKDCSAALKVQPEYEKALLRRMTACEQLGDDDLYKALEDAQLLQKLQPSNVTAQQTVYRLTPIVEKRKKEQMDEAMDNLKGIGNSVLGYFGMSLDNFKTSQNPDGTYGVSFEQNP